MQNKNIRVVIAEDDFIVKQEIISMLEGAGYDVVGTASDGIQAIETVSKEKPDVVILDIQMPNMDGLEAADIIQDKCPAPVVILSAYESLELVQQAGIVGVCAYLTKPPRESEIDRAITIAIARHQDIIKLRSATDKLYSEIEKKELLIREMNHRAKNNLGLLQSLLRLQSKEISDEKARSRLHESEARVKSISMLHEYLYKTADSRKIDISQYVRELITSLENSFRTDESKIELTVDTKDIKVDKDSVIPIGLVVNELVTNSLKYAFPNGEGIINVSVKQADNEIQISVKDNGIGLTDDFDMSKSMSLGMQIVSALSKQLGANLEINRSNGTEFILSFPVNDYLHEAKEDATGEKPGVQKQKILVIEDDRISQLSLKRFLTKAGYDFEIHNNGRESLEYGDLDGCSLVITDLLMPVMDGYQTAIELRQRGFKKPILAMTGSSEDTDQEKITQGGIGEVISKPIDFSMLRRLLSKYLEQ
jgi:two-component sensor histidine kinase